jgi:hypothetical protein
MERLTPFREAASFRDKRARGAVPEPTRLCATWIRARSALLVGEVEIGRSDVTCKAVATFCDSSQPSASRSSEHRTGAHWDERTTRPPPVTASAGVVKSRLRSIAPALRPKRVATAAPVPKGRHNQLEAKPDADGCGDDE